MSACLHLRLSLLDRKSRKSLRSLLVLSVKLVRKRVISVLLLPCLMVLRLVLRLTLTTWLLAAVFSRFWLTLLASFLLRRLVVFAFLGLRVILSIRACRIRYLVAVRRM